MLVAPVIPLLVLFAAATSYEWIKQREQVYNSLADTALAISVAVDREIDRSKAILETLAASELIDAKDWRAFHRLASAAIKESSDTFIALTEPTGEQPVRTMLPFGAPGVNPAALAQAHTEIEWNGRRLPVSTQGLSKRVFETGRSANSGLYYGVSIKKPAVAVAIPVMRDGRVVYVLIKAFAVDRLVTLLQSVRANVRIGLIDSSGRIIARNQRPADAIGSVVSDTLKAAVKSSTHGTRDGTNIDGQTTMTAFRRMENVDWAVNVSTPKSEALATATQLTLIWVGLALALLGVGLYGARRLWLRVAPPIALLGRSAHAIQRGEDVNLPASDISEINDLAAMLNAAAASERRERAEATRRAVAEERERASRELVMALSKSEARFRTLFEHSGTGIVSVDLATGRFVLVNRRFCEITGYSEQELLERTFGEITHPEDRARDVAATKELLIGKRTSYDTEKRYLRKDGAVRWVQLHVRQLPDPDGTQMLSFSSITDISERKEAEFALKQADRRKDEFLATLAHELRNPLAPLRTGVEMLERRHDDPATVVRLSAMMKRQVTHMVQLIDDLLDVSRIATGQLRLRQATVNIIDVLDVAVEACQSAIHARGHRCSVILPQEPLLVKGDDTRLIQAIENLLTNAAKYTESPGEIILRASHIRDKAVISVKDTGIGIPADKLDAVFGIFAQIHGTRGTGKEHGLGIGLHLVQQIIALHGGTVVARSGGAGTGSEFVFELPLLSDLPAAADEKVMVKDSSATLDILVVDDNRDAADTLAEVLRVLGHQAQAVFDGQAALDRISTRCPQLILLDLGMPDLDGYEVARRIRATCLPTQPVIVAVSGWGQDCDKAKTASEGFDRHLVKPVDIDELKEIVATVAARGADAAP